MEVIISVLKIIIVLGTLITIHELGHFLVAKACKVKVLKFAIGFGPKIFSKQLKETEYTLRLIPFGGFVQLEGEEEVSEDQRAFQRRPIYQRVLIVAAGATVNILFALLVFLMISITNNLYYGNQIAELSENDFEYTEGLRSGDRVLAVNHQKVLTGYEIERVIENAKEETFLFEVEREKQKKEVTVDIPTITKGLLGIRYDTEKRVVGISEDAPVASTSLQSGDEILAIDGIVIDTWEKIAEIIGARPNQEISLKIRRGEIEEIITTETTATTGRFHHLVFATEKPMGFTRFTYAWHETGLYFSATIQAMAGLFQGKMKNVEVMGPVGVAKQITQTSNAMEFFYLMSAISLSLGIFNLLPIPGLDGGKIVILIIEKIRKKPMKQETEAMITMLGFSLLILLVILVTTTDIQTLIKK